jgi:pimeloyl-ACP methyl ester carboxylesterase
MTDGSAREADQIATERVHLHGQEVAYRRAGDGPVLLLLHGIASSSEAWLPTMELLRHRFTVLAPDLFGHGQSAKPRSDYSLGNHAAGLRDLLQILGLEGATLIGHSFGGGVAMQFAYQFPERCERLVLVDAGGLGREVNWMLRLVTLPGAEYVMPAIFSAPVRDLGESIISFLETWGFRNARASEAWRSFASLTEPGSRQAFVRTMRAVIDPGGQSVSAKDRLYLVMNLPTLIIWGDKDKIIPVAHAYEAHEAIPGSRLEILEGVGHVPQLEEPRRFVEILVDFLGTTRPRGTTPEGLRDQLRRGSN